MIKLSEVCYSKENVGDHRICTFDVKVRFYAIFLPIIIECIWDHMVYIFTTGTYFSQNGLIVEKQNFQCFRYEKQALIKMLSG